MRFTLPILLGFVLFSGCTGIQTEFDVVYWELENTVEVTGDAHQNSAINLGGHCSWLKFNEDETRLSLQSTPGEAVPKQALGHRWVGDIPRSPTFGSGYEWFSEDASVTRSYGNDIMTRATWEGDTLWIDGEQAVDGKTWTIEYTYDDEQGDGPFQVKETLTLREYGSIPMTVDLEDELVCL